jgi:hypothetical protein
MSDPNPAELVDRLVDALDPNPATRALVASRIAGFADELADAESLGDIVTAAENPTTIGAPELAARAGVTYRQINYWSTEGYLATDPETTGSGNAKAYPPGQILKARLMGSLVRNFTMSPRAASEIADEIVTNGRAHVGPFTVTRDGRVG